jgi:RNA polymerase sigma factor for flagellar operon FliA
MPQARSEAWRAFQRAPHVLDRDELTSLAYTGLAMAASMWGPYCERRGFSPQAYQYFAAYALRRMRGAILDYQRSVDYVSRSVRSRAKAITEAGYDVGASVDEVAAETSLTPAQIRDTVAAVSRRPVSMDAEPVDVAEVTDVEGQAQVHLMLEAAVAALRKLPEEVQIVIALHYHQSAELEEIAAVLNRSKDEIAAFHIEGCFAVRDAMAQAISEAGSS